MALVRFLDVVKRQRADQAAVLSRNPSVDPAGKSNPPRREYLSYSPATGVLLALLSSFILLRWVELFGK